MITNILIIFAGAAFGATLRWLIGILLPQTIPLAFGILLANWTGALLIGICTELVQHPLWRLLLITGFLGSLTTFSSFSLEIVNMLQTHRWIAALSTTALHLFGSLIFTAMGIALVQQFK